MLSEAPRVLFALLVMLIVTTVPLQPASAQAPTKPNITFAPIADGLNQPVHITHAGDGSGRTFIVERAGQIRILSSGSLLPIYIAVTLAFDRPETVIQA